MSFLKQFNFFHLLIHMENIDVNELNVVLHCIFCSCWIQVLMLFEEMLVIVYIKTAFTESLVLIFWNLFTLLFILQWCLLLFLVFQNLNYILPLNEHWNTALVSCACINFPEINRPLWGLFTLLELWFKCTLNLRCFCVVLYFLVVAMY